MTTIASGTKEIIINNPLINEALALGLNSHAKLAEFIKPQLEEKMKGSIKIHTVIMAIRRYEEGLLKKQRIEYNSLFKEINIKTDISFLILKNNKLTVDLINNLFDKIIEKKNEFYHFINDGKKIWIIANNSFMKEILLDIKDDSIEKLYLNTVSIVLKYSQKRVESLDIFQNILWKLSCNNIRVVTWIDKDDELVLLVNEKDVISTYNILRKFKKSIEISPSTSKKKNIKILTKD